MKADATGWMALFSLNMLEVCLILGKRQAEVVDDAVMYLSHFLHTAQALNLNIQSGGK